MALGDSTTVGIGDRVRGGWRGFAPLLAEALYDDQGHQHPGGDAGGGLAGPGTRGSGQVPSRRRLRHPRARGADAAAAAMAAAQGAAEELRLANLSFPGARIGCVRDIQLPTALSMRPDAAVLVAGINDTLRSDFDPDRLHDDLDRIVGELTAAGTVVVTARYHDHSRVFKIPGPLSRALSRRIGELNEILDTIVARYGAQCLDLATLPGAYELPVWSVDRLHPSEIGHRLLARGFGELLAEAGCLVPRPVSLERSGGRQPSRAEHMLWLVLKGLPWLVKRSADLLPYAARIWWRDLRGLDPLAPSQSSRKRGGPARTALTALSAQSGAGPNAEASLAVPTGTDDVVS